MVQLSILCFFRLNLKLLSHLYLELPSGPFLSYLNNFFLFNFSSMYFKSPAHLLHFISSSLYSIWCMVKASHSMCTPLKVARCIFRFCPVNLSLTYYLQLQNLLTFLGLNSFVSYSVLREEIFLASAGVIALLPSQNCFDKRLVSGAAIYCGLFP